eukprot:scaffold12327_cov54-Phaeocystis_antarctica.AAC.2
MDSRRSWLRKPTGRRSPAALTVPADLASEASSLKKRLGKVNTSPEDGFWRLDFAGAPHDDSQEHINIGRRRIASGWSYRPARHAWASRNGRPEKPGLLTVICPRSGPPQGGARFTAKRPTVVRIFDFSLILATALWSLLLFSLILFSGHTESHITVRRLASSSHRAGPASGRAGQLAGCRRSGGDSPRLQTRPGREAVDLAERPGRWAERAERGLCRCRCVARWPGRGIHRKPHCLRARLRPEGVLPPERRRGRRDRRGIRFRRNYLYLHLENIGGAASCGGAACCGRLRLLTAEEAAEETTRGLGFGGQLRHRAVEVRAGSGLAARRGRRSVWCRRQDIDRRREGDCYFRRPAAGCTDFTQPGFRGHAERRLGRGAGGAGRLAWLGLGLGLESGVGAGLGLELGLRVGLGLGLEVPPAHRSALRCLVWRGSRPSATWKFHAPGLARTAAPLTSPLVRGAWRVG